MSISSIGSSAVYSALTTRIDQSTRKVDTYGATTISSNSSSSINDLFSSLDSDGDGSITETEFSDALNSLLALLNEQSGSSTRGQEGMGSMPPPPPDREDSGFSLEELNAQLEELGDSDPARASLLSSIIANFDAADSDGDGKVTFEEAMALQDTLTESNTSAQSTSSTEDTQAEIVLARILQLAQSYGAFQSAAARFSVSA